MIEWTPNVACNYRFDYAEIFRRIAISKAGRWQEFFPDKEEINEVYALRHLILNDLFFVVQFLLEIPPTNKKTGEWFCNHPFVVERCKEVESGQDGWCLDLWSRGHFKSSIITIGRTIQRICRDPESCTMIASHTRPAAKKFFRSIKLLFESSAMLKQCFPYIMWENPEREAPKWSLSEDTPVFTTSGWKRHGDLNIGDKIFGSKGQVTTVLGTSGTIRNADCRRIVFDDCEIIASSEHLWPVQQRNSTAKRWTWKEVPDIKIIRTDDLPYKDKGQRLPASPLISFPESRTPLPLDPYILGLWLGDGTAGTNIISMERQDEKEILDQLSASGLDYYIHRKKLEDNFSMYGVRGLKEILSSLGCLRKKHVPESYLFTSTANRIALLQGLMDSDGTCKKQGPSRAQGMCMFSNVNRELADSVFFLAASLGLRPSHCSFMPKTRGRQQANHIYFVGLTDRPPFRLKRKLDLCKDKRIKVGRYVRSIDKIDSVPVNCIKVDAPDHIYLAGRTMVPTHNSEDDGIIVRRKSVARKEATLEAWGIKEGMPIGVHFDKIILDDLETEDDVMNPMVVDRVQKAVELTNDLLSVGGTIDVVGTPYSHVGVYIPYIRDLKKADDSPVYNFRRYAATDDGTMSGNPVFLSREEWDNLKTRKGEYTLSCQQLINPTPVGTRRLAGELIKDIEPQFIPRNRFKFMVIDGAGDDKTGKGDAWAVGVIGVEPYGDDLGASRIFIEDLLISPLREEEAPEEIARMYRRNGLIMQVGIEKVGMSTVEIHVANALAKYGVYLSVDKQNLVLLRPAGLDNQTRISKALPWPMFNGKIFLSTAVPSVYADRLRHEADHFPFFHDDGLTILAYLYTMIKDFHFGWFDIEDDYEEPRGKVMEMGRNSTTGY